MRYLLVLLVAGCAISGGPVVGLRQGKISYGWNVGPQFAFFRADVGQSIRAGGPARGHRITYGALGIAVPVGREPPDGNIGALLDLGYAGGDCERGPYLSVGGITGTSLRSPPSGDYGTWVVGIVAIGVRWLAGGPEVWLAPQLAVANIPDLG